MPLPFYNSIKTEKISQNSQISQNNSQFAAISPSARHYGPTELSETLKIWEKGQLTSPDDRYALWGKDKDIIPHKDMPWGIYREAYRRIPLVYNSVNNTADFAMQAGFELDTSKDAKTRILDWFDETNFELILRNIFIQMQIYGNAYLDISDIKFPKLLQPDNMFVQVRKGGADDGKIIGYKQKSTMDPRNDVTFSPEELIHFKWNDAVNPFYGFSEIHPALGPITRYENWALDLGEILHRYAAPFFQWRLGTNDYPATQDQIDNFKATIENRLPGEDIVTSTAVENVTIGSGGKMIQVDGLVKSMENQIISALRIPEVFARGGESSNKATAAVELQAFDRKVKALQVTVGMLLEDYLFTKITKGKVKIIWSEFSSEGELMRAQRLQALVTAGVPLKVAIQMVGLSSWVDDIEDAQAEQEQKAVDKGMFRSPDGSISQMKNPNNPSQNLSQLGQGQQGPNSQVGPTPPKKVKEV